MRTIADIQPKRRSSERSDAQYTYKRRKRVYDDILRDMKTQQKYNKSL